MHNFRKLIVWENAIEIAVKCNEIVIAFSNEYKFSLGSQILRSAISIGSNIAEGADRDSTPSFKQFLIIANGSCFELETQLIIGKNLGIIPEDHLDIILNKLEVVQKQLYKLIHSLKTGKSS